MTTALKKRKTKETNRRHHVHSQSFLNIATDLRSCADANQDNIEAYRIYTAIAAVVEREGRRVRNILR